MPRSVSGKVKHKKTKNILKAAKGYRGAKSKLYRPAKQAVMKAGLYAFRDRRAKKRDFRGLWISRINARARMEGLSYSKFINGLEKAGVIINRKLLSDIAVNDDIAFRALVEKAKTSG